MGKDPQICLHSLLLWLLAAYFGGRRVRKETDERFTTIRVALRR